MSSRVMKLSIFSLYFSHINAYVTRIEHAFSREKKNPPKKERKKKIYNKRKQRRTAEALVNTLDELSA